MMQGATMATWGVLSAGNSGEEEGSRLMVIGCMCPF